MMLTQNQSDEAAEGAIRRIISAASEGKISQSEMHLMLREAYYPCVGKHFHECDLSEIEEIMVWHLQQMLDIEYETQYLASILGKNFHIGSDIAQ